MSDLNLGPDKSDGQKLYGSDWNELKKKLEEWANDPQIGNSNIDENQKIAYIKLNLINSILDADINSISINKFTSLKAQQQSTPNLTVQVGPGTYITAYGAIHKTFAGGNSPAFDVSGITSGNSRIDLLYIDEAGTLKIYEGIQAVTPKAPRLKIGLTPICYVYLRYTSSAIYNTDQGGTSAYIYADLRPFFYFPKRLAFSGNDLLDHFDFESVDSAKWTTTTSGTGSVTAIPGEHEVRCRVGAAVGQAKINSKCNRAHDPAMTNSPMATLCEFRCKGELAHLNNSIWGLVDSGGTHYAKIEEGTAGGTVKFSTGDGASTTTTDNISSNDNYNIYTIVLLPTQAKLYINGTLVATHTTNLPTNALAFNFDINSAPGASKDYFIDYVKWICINLDELNWE